jgi:tight adherence protein C
LVQAGYESSTAPLTYAGARAASLVGLPILVLLAFPTTGMNMIMLGVGAVVVAYVIPRAWVDRKARLRQERIRRALPDALDLMVVCVEAGVSLDAAVLRVARELQIAHAELAYEFAVVNRKTNAGVTREEALRGLWERTGVEDIRSLISSMIQSEKWGTSIARVLRVAAETLRRKRRQAAEKRAALAPLKMTIPLVTLILPSMFIVILGPVMLKMMETFKD